jgi:hypothetical protein
MFDFIREAKKAASGQWPRLLPELASVDARTLAGKHVPCPVCGGKDRFRAFPDFAVSGGTICNQCGTHADGIATLAWMNGLGQGEAAKLIAGHLGISRRNGQAGPVKVQNTDRAGGELRDRVYRAILDECPLLDEDRERLQQRGLDDGTIENGYGSLEPSKGQQVAQGVLTRTGIREDELCQVPGIVRKNGSLTLTGWLGPGLLIPCRGTDGRIQSLKVRRRQPSGNQARYVSLSGGQQHNQNAGSHCHVPGGLSSTCQTVRVTEGELKADVATALSQLPTVSVPGIGQWKSALPVLEELKAETVLVAFDSPEYSDPGKPTAKEAAAFARELIARGFEVEIETWDAGDGKGIDDVFGNGGETSAMELDGLLSLRPDLVEAEDEAPRQTGWQPNLLTSSEFAKTDFRQNFFVKRVLAEGQHCVIGGPPKAMKTGLAIDLAVSLGTGTPFLSNDDFFVPQRVRTCVLSGESGGFTLQHTADRICKARNRILSTADILWGFDLPQLSNTEHLKSLEEMIRTKEVRVLIIDPAYLCLLAGNSQSNPANVFAMGEVLRRVGDLGQRTDCTVVVVHHCRKVDRKDRYRPIELSDLSMSGFAEWARQWLLVGRRREYEGDGRHELHLAVGGSAGHSGNYFVTVDEGTMEDGRKWKPKVERAHQAIERIKQRKLKADEDRKADKWLEDLEKINALMRTQFPEGETRNNIKNASHLNTAPLNEVLADLLKRKAIEICNVKKGNGQTYDGFRPVRTLGEQSGKTVVPDCHSHTQGRFPLIGGNP